MILESIEVSDRQLRALSKLVYEHCGIRLGSKKRELVQARLAKRMRATGYPTADAYIGHLLNNPESPEFDELIDAISTNLTSFYRENDHFKYLAEKHLPSLIARKGARSDRRLRGWSTACSSGEEPYTIAITALEATGHLRPSWDVRILATDISRPVLATARQGIYAQDRITPVPRHLVQKHFVDCGKGHSKVAPHLRDAVRFNYLNLMEAWPFSGPFDFIFCRNVMIYFDHSTQERLVKRLHDVLAPGGILFTGHSESLTGIQHSFRHVQPTIYAKS